MCMMASTLPGGRDVMIKQELGRQILLHLYQPGWSIGINERFTIGLSFDNGVAMTMDVSGHHWSRGIVSATIGEFGTRFTRDFMDAHTMTILFPGSEYPWYVSLRGSESMTYAFLECVDFMNAANRQPHRPFTQPHRRFR